MTSNIDSSLVTIGMPVYNGARYIRRALDSILTQNFSDFELIISDNASTDETSAICLEYAKRDGRIRYVRHERNSGAAVNYNFLLEATNSKYFFFAPHDDEWLADWVSAAVEALEESTNSSIVLGTIDFVNKENELVARDRKSVV